jgi:hypothetical protein
MDSGARWPHYAIVWRPHHSYAHAVQVQKSGVLQRIAPGVREVLCLVYNDRVESMPRLELCCEAGHLEWEVVLAESHGLVGP